MFQKILVVEDDELSQMVIVEMCRDLGFECQTADDGRQAVSTLTAQADTISVVLMDIHMPIVSGLEAVNEIRLLPTNPPQNTPVIAITADVSWHNPELCKHHGFDSVLEKPVSIKRLSEELNRFANAS